MCEGINMHSTPQHLIHTRTECLVRPMDVEAERLIARYLRHPETLGEAARRRAEHLLARDAGAERYADFLRTFYRVLADEAERERSARVEQFVDDLFGASSTSTVEVRPFRPPSGPRPTVLAAATRTDSDDRRFSVLTTLAAEQEEVLVRVLGDHETGEGRVYVLTGASAGPAHAIVSFPELGMDLVTDADGRQTFALPSAVDRGDWEDAVAVVRQPVASRLLAPGSTVELGGPSGATATCRFEDGALIVRLRTENEGVTALLTGEPAEGDGRLLLRLCDEGPERRSVSVDDPLRLRLYE